MHWPPRGTGPDSSQTVGRPVAGHSATSEGRGHWHATIRQTSGGDRIEERHHGYVIYNLVQYSCRVCTVSQN